MSTNSVPKQIIAMGGGGFSMEPENPLLDRYILGLSKKKRPKICFIPTASGDSDKYIVRFYSAFVQLLCQPSHLSLFNPPTSDFRSFVLEQDIIYVGGGNTKNLNALWKEWGLDHVLREAWESGVILSGLSAGSICWFESPSELFWMNICVRGNMKFLEWLLSFRPIMSSLISYYDN